MPTSATDKAAPASASQPKPPSPPPARLYRDRQTALRALETTLGREHLSLGYVRLAFGVAIVLLLLPPIPAVFIPLAAFVLAARAHSKILDELAGTRRALAYYDRGLARLEDRWAALEPRGTRLDVTKSLYAADLDFFGPGSLFTLLCEARTSPGEDTLASWLLAPSPVADLPERQHTVADLQPRTALREAFAAAPGPAIAALDRDALAAWGEAPARNLPGALRWISPVLVVLTLLAAWRFAVVHSPLLLAGILAVDAGLTFAHARSYKLVFAEAEQARRSLATVAALLRLLETDSFAAARAQVLQAGLRRGGKTASEALGQLAALAQWADARSNYVVRILDAPLLYSLQLALLTERWRARHGSHLGQWLDVLGETEALLSLAGYSFEHPDDPFPQIATAGASFAATGLGHPLLPASACVRNDVSLGPETGMLLVSGSNMSGKSTLLRAVGVNAVLAFAGAPVRAYSLTLSPLTVAASIQVSDSLQGGRSRFYAEILRLRAITEAAHSATPVLFLLDELLAGTNSSDRLAGARGLVRELLGAGAIGLLSTHDLALTSLAAAGQELTGEVPPVRNVHFQDEIADGQLRFDFTLHEGPVERSNGLLLMRLIGLDV